jgi:methionine aminopeptidase, type II
MLTDSELEKLRKAGRIAAQAVQLGMDMVDDNVKLYDVAEEVEGYIRSHGAKPAFPCNLSINEVAAHYTPTPKDKLRFEIGDVVKVDAGAHIDGFVGDTAGTVEVRTKNFTHLIESAKKARDTVMEFIGDGIQLKDIGRAVDSSIRSDGYRPIANLSGHQIVAYTLHAGLSIPNYDDGNTETVKKGMIIAVEPFATNGGGEIRPGKASNIYRIVRERPIEDPDLKIFFEDLKEEVSTFPFCERWLDDPKASQKINKLMRHGLISGYSQCIEVKGGCVTQWEHTVYIEGKRAEITTLL